jgi:hypothetical protein
MKKTALFIISILILAQLQAQLKTTIACPVVNVNILDGKVNDFLIPTSNADYIQKQLPCFSSAETESATAKCGGGVFYKDKDIYFYTGRDYIEIGPKFKGKLSVPLMGAARNSLFKSLGNPKIKDVNWDAYTTAYGTLILYFNKLGKVNKIQFSTLSTDVLNLCE